MSFRPLAPDLDNASVGKYSRDLLRVIRSGMHAVFCLSGGDMLPIVNLSLQVLPAVEEENLYRVVDRVIEMIDQRGVKYEVGPMETTMEGELGYLLDIVKKAQKICTEEGAKRVVSIVKIDYKEKGVTIDEKVDKYRKG